MIPASIALYRMYAGPSDRVKPQWLIEEERARGRRG